MTQKIYEKDSYLTEHTATVIRLHDNGVVLDSTIFYPNGGGQPGDSGTLTDSGGNVIEITSTITDRESQEIVHLTDNSQHRLSAGDQVQLAIAWETRYHHMKMHSCLHLLCSLIDAPVTGCSITAVKARLDFDLPESTLDKTDLSEKLNQLILSDSPVSSYWINEEELDNNPELIRTMSVKPPRNRNGVRVINLEGVDQQPCGGTHVKSTAEIGSVMVKKIEKKSKHNRRVTVVFDE